MLSRVILDCQWTCSLVSLQDVLSTEVVDFSTSCSSHAVVSAYFDSCAVMGNGVGLCGDRGTNTVGGCSQVVLRAFALMGYLGAGQ